MTRANKILNKFYEGYFLRSDKTGRVDRSIKIKSKDLTSAQKEVSPHMDDDTILVGLEGEFGLKNGNWTRVG